MNDDAQQEVCYNFYIFFLISCSNVKYSLQISMFLRATEMNPTDLSLGGFFDVNRNLFKSVSLNSRYV